MKQAPENDNTGTNNDPTTKIRQIQVILMRHGEREDEAEEYDKSQKTRQERVDPALTVLGHQQALGAWRKILAYVPNDKPIMLACSPLQRCIGTALMVAAAASSASDAGDVSSVPQFVLPTDNISDHPERSGEETDPQPTIPVLVMNGLGDCAAQMRHMGGIGKVVKEGWLQCAASPVNDCLADAAATTPLQNTLQTIASNGAHLQTRWGSSVVTQSCKLSFWREAKYHYFESTPTSDLCKMSEPRTIQEHEEQYHAIRMTTHPESPIPMPKNASSSDEVFEQAIERAVLQTAHAGLNTCILVTHREAIRWIENRWVPGVDNQQEDDQQHPRLSLTAIKNTTRSYCCVADYKVSLDLTDPEQPRFLSWETQKVVPWPALERNQE